MAHRRLVLAFVAVLALPARADVPAKSPSLIAQAEEKLRVAGHERDAKKRDQLAAEAMALAKQAAKAAPNDPEPHLAMGRVWSLADPDHPEACKPGACEQAVAELRLARKLDAQGLDAEKIASELGIALSRLGRYEEALVEYDHALRRIDPEKVAVSLRWDDRGGQAILYGNSAETLMALGRLDQAIARYKQARDAAEQGKLEWQLAEWGLAVALDRDEQGDLARDAVTRVLERDPTMAHLSDDGVFFEPAGDKWYYLALGHEVAGDRAEALAAWKSYLAAPDARWARRARAHLDALKKSRVPSLPAALVSFGEPESFVGLRSESELRQSLIEHEDEVRLCYQRALRVMPSLRGELFLALDVIPAGYVYPEARVFQTRFDGASDDDQVVRELRDCVQKAAANWRFSSVERPGNVPVSPENVMVRVLLGPLR